MNDSLDISLATKLCKLVVEATPDNDPLQPKLAVAILRALTEAVNTTSDKVRLTDEERVVLAALRTICTMQELSKLEILQRVLAILKKTRDQPIDKEVAEQITDREREVLISIATSHTNKEIATALNIGVRTVETHRERIMKKLGIHDAAGLTRYALRKGLITLDQ